MTSKFYYGILHKFFNEGSMYSNSQTLEHEFILYFNSKIVRWKKTYFTKNEKDKCRICECEISVSELANHSYICYKKNEWREDVLVINKELDKCSESLEKFINKTNLKNETT
jgi:hypothetical protein